MTKSIADETNLRGMEDAIPLFHGQDFQKHLSDCVEHALITERELNKAKRNMYNYIITVGKALERRFPDIDFITAFLDPSLRKLQQPDMLPLVNTFLLALVLCKLIVVR